ncbi:tyrosine-protein phosphatase non-receptor type 13-like [Vanessa atalanta]|uniref:tyrosine-protein phosphatase non-receptor type 13-like n=1 Tax=Vanessa atalanta TaxID=42275 RepID=UPI001FCCDDEE|nr:tyrosine-protein phosphatase non-receptor type 13-like [Vanessa atalanta]
MPRNCDEDSGRSSCSATSITLSPVFDIHQMEPRKMSKEKKFSTDLKVCTQPRNFANILKSPDERDPFPSCRLTRNHRKAVFTVFDTPRLGGLSNAHSSINIACSTQIETNIPDTVSMTALNKEEDYSKKKNFNSNFRSGKPVQRAASRLYRAESLKGKEGCVGPEFIVRASQPVKHLDLTISALCDKKVITVVLLNGQRIEVICDPNTITAGQIFEALVLSEKYEHNFMLGIAILIGGDFIFLPDDYKIKKVVPDQWHKTSSKLSKGTEEISVSLFLRIKFFLPINVSNNIQDGEWRHRVYLQLRRAIVEGQMFSTIQNLILLAGYALHIEFGEFSYREHGTADYFLLEHYLPESLIINDMTDVKFRMKRAHESRRGLDRSKAIINYITLAQTFRDYGAHFYSAIWATRDGFCRDVWLSIGPRGVTIYSRTNNNSDESSSNPNRIVLQSLPWHHIHTFYYNKKSLYIMPNAYSGLSKIGIKYKLKMTDNKSYFAFWLVSLHHRLYLKLYAKDDFVNYLSSELNCPLNVQNSPKKVDCSNYQDSYNLAVRNPRVKRPIKRRFKVDLFSDKKSQNKENEKPSTEQLLRQILSPQPSDESIISSPNRYGQRSSSNEGLSSSESSLPRRHGVKMGTRVFNGMKSTLDGKYAGSPSKLLTVRSDGDLATAHSDSDDLSSEQRQHCNINSMQLLPERCYSQNMIQAPTAYVLESPKVYSDVYSYDTGNESCVNTSIFERLDNMECVQGERVFVTAVLERDKTNALGLQVAEGSDGNVYIKSITPGSAADVCGKLLPGDQIISVNGQTLLNLKYDKALNMLQSAPQLVELIVLQNTSKNTICDSQLDNTLHAKEKTSRGLENSLRHSIASALDVEITDDELLNEEALKTIYALIKLTKEKVISRMKEKSVKENIIIGSNLQKCQSEIKVYEKSDLGNYSSHEDTPQKKSAQKFNTWRGQLTNSRPKRRPLSLSIPTDVHIPDDYLNEKTNNPLTRKSIQSSINSLDQSVKSSSIKNVALPRNFGLSRRWLGPVRYPVTPCKNSNIIDTECAIDGNVVRRHFIYGTGDSDEEQIFL